MKKITAIIPCHNEAEGIAQVIDGFPKARLRRLGYSLEVIVIDNNSTDSTAEVARAHGALVVHESRKGKGNAIRAGLDAVSADTDYVVMLDGDDTYASSEVLRLVEPLHSEFCDVVIGSRLGGKIAIGSMRTFNHLGNRIYSRLVRHTYRVKVTDVLTGYFAWTKPAIDTLRPHLVSPGFAIEMEMITKMARLGLNIYSVPISYHARAGESNLSPVRDGARIMRVFFQNLVWTPRSGGTVPTVSMEPAFYEQVDTKE